jgi:hypothetical protein
MPYTQITENEIIVSGYGLDTWLIDVERAFGLGFKFDFTDNQAYPQQVGSHYNAIMKKPKAKVKGQIKGLEGKEGVETAGEGTESSVKVD